MTEPIKITIITPENIKKYRKKFAYFEKYIKSNWGEPERVRKGRPIAPADYSIVNMFAEIKGKPIGWLKLYQSKAAKEALTDWIEIAPELRSKKIGLAELLETKAFYYCKRKGLAWQPWQGTARKESLTNFRAALERKGSLSGLYTARVFAIKAAAAKGGKLGTRELPAPLARLREIELEPVTRKRVQAAYKRKRR